MDDMLEIIKRKLPNLSNMDVEMLRSIFTSYCINLICDDKIQKELINNSITRSKSNWPKKKSRSKRYNSVKIESSLVPPRRRGRPRRNTLPVVPPSVPNPLDSSDIF